MILDKTFPPDPRVENEALALKEKGHEVHLFCCHHAREIARDEYKGFVLHRYPYGKLEYKLSALAYTFPFYQWLMSPKIRNFVKTNSIEAVHIHDIRIAGSVFEAIKGMYLPSVLDLHDNFPEVMKEYPHLKKFPGKWMISPEKWKKKESEFMEMADKVVCVSYEMADQLKERVRDNSQKVVLVPNTVRKDFYTSYEVDKSLLKRFKNDFVLLYIGDTGLRRGLLTAIEGLSLLMEKIENIKLVIVGAGTEDRILKQKAVELKVSGAVVFEGWQEPNRFQSYILSSAVCLSPLNRSLQHDVAYANKLFQYMSLSRPVLVSDAVAQRKLIEKQKSGLVHKEKDPEDFAEKVMNLYRDPVLREELGARGHQFVDKVFRWELMSEKLSYMYKELSGV